jgi:hypothetical protein
VARFLALTRVLSVSAWFGAKRVALHDSSAAVAFVPEPNFTPLSNMAKCHACPAVAVCTSTPDSIRPASRFSVSFHVLAALRGPVLMTVFGAVVRAEAAVAANRVSPIAPTTTNRGAGTRKSDRERHPGVQGQDPIR